MATGLMIAAVGLQAGGQIFGGIAARKQSKKQKRALEAQAAFNRQQAKLERELGEFEATQQARSFDRLIGRQRLSIAASGIKLEGSPLDIIDESLRDKEETIANIRMVAESRARALEFGAGQLMQQGKDVARAGRNALIGSIFGAAGSAIGAAAKKKGMKTGGK